MLDQLNTKNELESSTIRTAIVSMVSGAIFILGTITGMTEPLLFVVKQVVDGLGGNPDTVNVQTISEFIAGAIMLIVGWKARKGRINATRAIRRTGL